MVLIVEDGTGLSTSDTYQSLVDARASAALLGLSLPVDDFDAEIALRSGARYVNRYESQFSGQRLEDSQSLSWPRADAYKKYGYTSIDISDSEIPKEIIIAQMMAAVEYGKGTEIMPVDDGLSVQSNEVVGAVKQSYFDNRKTGGEVVITQAVDALTALLCNGVGLNVRIFRV